MSQKYYSNSMRNILFYIQMTTVLLCHINFCADFLMQSRASFRQRHTFTHLSD